MRTFILLLTLLPGSQAFVGGYSYQLCMHENDTLKYMKAGNNGCDVLTSVSTENKPSGLQIWQVTPDGQFMIERSHSTISSVTFEVVNLLGSVVYSQPFTLPLIQPIDLSSLTSGIYILSLRNDQINITRKFFKR
jgi:hypothetical protein